MSRKHTIKSLILGLLALGCMPQTHAVVISVSNGPFSSVAGAWDLDFGNSPQNNGAPLNTALPSGTLGHTQYSYTGGALFNFDTSSSLPQGISARPPGSTGNFWSIGTAPSSQNGPGVVEFDSGVRYFGFLWGSPDTYNQVSYYDGAELLGTFDGSAILIPPTGDQTYSRYLNAFTQPGEVISRIVFTSTNNAFETDHHAFISAVPEPGSLYLIGLSLIGLGAIRKRRTKQHLS